MLDKIKILLGLADNDSKDDLLIVLIGLAKDEAMDYCNLIEYSDKLDSAVIGMTIEKFNSLGSEGLISTTANGVKEDYINGYSKSVIVKLNKCRRIRLV